ncbi:MAG: hypothetical protein R3360_03360 [Alphaproteobacteria bacterium]|nr:hypothetical protein [Alphaproteobacteria bacterium]
MFYKSMEVIRNLAAAITGLMILITLGLFSNDNDSWLLTAFLSGVSGWAWHSAQDWLDRHTFDYVGHAPVYKRRKK